MMSSSARALVALMLATLGAAAPAGAQLTDHFTCYKAAPTAGTAAFGERSGVQIVDRFATSTVDVRKPQLLCAPTSKNGENPTAPSHPDHLEGYRIKPTTRFATLRNQTVVDQFGTHALDVQKPVGLQVPTAKSVDAPPPAPVNPALDHFRCYKVRTAKGATKFAPVSGIALADQFGALTVEVRRIRRLCVPADKNGEEPGAESHPDQLLCYQVRETSRPRFARHSPLFTQNQFGAETLDAKKPAELCVPAAGVPVGPTATPTPSATVTPAPTATSGLIVAGAAVVNLTPFTLTPALLACRADPGCPYHDVLALSNPDVSNPDGLPGGLFQTIGEEMAPGVAATDWVGPTGLWGEAYTDADGNGRFDDGESFTDDPANSSPVVGAGYDGPLGDTDSTNKWDGVYIAGYGVRTAQGAFDPITARVLFLRDTRSNTSIAWVTLDFVGYFSDFVGRIRARLPGSVSVDHIILTHTHDHESVDMVGLWGKDTTTDGTYPRYKIYVEAKIAEAIAAAAANPQPARFRFGTIHPGEGYVTPNGNPEDMTGMIGRNSCRTPWVFDDELRVMQVTADTPAADTIATLINWGAHVESMDSQNRYLSSDFAGAARRLVEQQVGGVALYTPSAQGDAEIIGDSCNRRWNRHVFDGEDYPVATNGEPLAFGDPYDNGVVRDRTYAIGRVVGAAALAAVAGKPLDPPDAPFELLGPRLLCFPVNNEGLSALAAAGVIDKPLANAECPTGAGAPPDRGKSAFYAFRIGSGSFLTAPGEVFPELYYGVSVLHRSAGIGHYVSPNPDHFACAAHSHHGPDQPGAHSDRPYEPTIRAAQVARFGTPVNFLIGYTPDLLGYIVPGYDFFWLGGQGGFGIPVDEIADPCSELPPDLAFPDAKYGSHYHETNSAGSMLAPAVACELVRMLGDPYGEAASSGACAEWDSTNATGRPPVEPPPIGYEPGCPADPTACGVRHY